MFQLPYCLSYSDASGNPVTQQVQSVAVTDASGNPVTGKLFLFSIMLIYCQFIYLTNTSTSFFPKELPMFYVKYLF